MTFEQFYTKANHLCHNRLPHTRIGQTLFAYLYQIRPDLANALTGSESDPFFRESEEVYGKFWNYVQSNWER